MSNKWVVPSIQVFTHNVFASAEIEASTGIGIVAGSPIVATSLACHSLLALWLISQSFEVSAEKVIAQSSSSFSDQRISSGVPGTLKIFSGCMRLKFHSTIVLPKCFKIGRAH